LSHPDQVGARRVKNPVIQAHRTREIDQRTSKIHQNTESTQRKILNLKFGVIIGKIFMFKEVYEAGCFMLLMLNKNIFLNNIVYCTAFKTLYCK
jgi:hypothetical protein